MLCLCLTGCSSTHLEANPSTGESLLPAPEAPSTAPVGLPVFTDEHIAYMEPFPSGRFLPDGVVRRGEACQMLYRLLDNPVEGHCSFSDLSPDDDCYEAVAGLAAWGVISDSTGEFRPNDLLSRAQFVTMLSHFYPPAGTGKAPQVGSFLHHIGDYPAPAMLPGTPAFSDSRDHWAAAAIQNAADRGWVDAGGKFHPDVAITRVQFCQILNRVLGRRCDEAYVLLSGLYELFSDIPSSHPHFGDIMEACYSHQSHTENNIEIWNDQPLEPGFHRAYGHLYYVDEEGKLLRNDSYELWDFDETGRYTTGLPELDNTITAILLELGTDDMSRKEALRAVYRYTVDHDYIIHRRSSYGFDGVHGIYCFRALKFFQNGGGVCYDYASAFACLARALGYPAHIVTGQLSVYRDPHGWVMIPENGVSYIYDPEMESAHPERHGDLELFRTYNFSHYSYWW